MVAGVLWGGCLVTSIERTAYPRFRRVISARELHESFTPMLDEVDWARERTRSDQGLLALVVLLKSYQKLGCFPDLFEVPIPVVEHIRRLLELGPEIEAAVESKQTGKRYRAWVRRRVGVRLDPATARTLAERVVRQAAVSKDNPADLINVVLEELVRARLELPGYTTLDQLVAEIRTETNTGFYQLVYGRIPADVRQRLVDLLVVDPVTRRSRFDDINGGERDTPETRRRPSAPLVSGR